MSVNVIGILLKGKDEASSVLGNVGGAVAGFGKLALTTLAGTAGAVVGVGAALTKLAVDAAPVETIGQSFRDTADDADSLLAAFKKGSAGAVTNRDAMTSYNEAVQLVGKEFGDRLPDAMGFLGKVAGSTGQDVGFMLASLTTGVGRLSPQILDNLGIQVDLVQANKDWAASMGMAVSDMTKTQQQAAAMDQVMSLLATNTAGLPEVTGTAAAGMASLKATFADAKDEAGLALVPILGELTSWMGEILPPVISSLVTWFSGTLVPAIAMLWGFIQTDLFPLFEILKVWFAVNLPIAISTLTAFWTGTLLPALTTLWTWVTTSLFPLFQRMMLWLGTNIPIALQKLSAFWTLTLLPAITAVWAWANASLFPTLTSLALWLGENIPVALALLATFWQDTLLPAITTVWAFIQESVIPMFVDVLAWLEENIPPALEALAEFWELTLLPAIDAVWAFMVEDFFPMLVDLKKWLDETIPPILEDLATLWEDTILPALEAVWKFLSEDMVPIWDALGTLFDTVVTLAVDALTAAWVALSPVVTDLGIWLRDTFGPILTNMVTWFSNVSGGADGVKDAIKGVADKIKALADKIKKLKLPSWMTPGSPTPLELGLLGIAKAFGVVEKANLGDFSKPSFGNRRPPGDRPGQGGLVIHNHFGPGSVRSDKDIRKIQEGQERVLRIRGLGVVS